MTDLDRLYERQEELESAIDSAADSGNGELWEDLNDELEELEEEIDGLGADAVSGGTETKDTK